MSRKNKILIVTYIMCFALGGYVWKVFNTGHTLNEYGVRERVLGEHEAIVHIGDVSLTVEDVQWEYDQHTESVVGGDQLTFIPDVGGKLHEYLSPLKERLAKGLIERKLLLEMIKRDESFDATDPALFLECVQEWQDLIGADPRKFENQMDRERLKSRLCESALIKKYVDKNIYNKIQVDDKEVVAYFNKHASEFNQPQKVVIRQVVLATEEDAKKVRNKININNFASLAKQFSIAPEAEDGGILGPFVQTDMPRVFDIAFSMRRGDISDVLKSNYGFHIIMLEKKIPTEKLSLVEARSQIEKKIIKQKREEEYQKWVELALNTVPVKAPKPVWEQ